MAMIKMMLIITVTIKEIKNNDDYDPKNREYVNFYSKRTWRLTGREFQQSKSHFTSSPLKLTSLSSKVNKSSIQYHKDLNFPNPKICFKNT